MDDQTSRMLALATSGGVTGAILGAGSTLFSPFKKWSQLAKAAGLGTGLGAGAAVGSGYVGEKALGEPDITESNPYTKRGGLGGALLGGGAGGLAGAALGSGLAGSIAKKALPDNLMTKKLLEYARQGGLKKMGRLGAIGALIGGSALGYQGADEGMQMDVIENERRKKLLRDLYNSSGGDDGTL